VSQTILGQPFRKHYKPRGRAESLGTQNQAKIALIMTNHLLTVLWVSIWNGKHHSKFPVVSLLPITTNAGGVKQLGYTWEHRSPPHFQNNVWQLFGSHAADLIGLRTNSLGLVIRS
jgi:hypothetical protein